MERQNWSLLKRLQIAQAENKPWQAESWKYLTAYRSIPHSTTGRSPAELLFNRKVRGKIPDLRIDHVYDQEVHDHDAEQKAKTKDYADTQRRASHSSVEIGDEVLVQQGKTNKLSTAFNPTPFQGCQQERKQPRDRKPNREAVFQKHKPCETVFERPCIPARTGCLDNTCPATHRGAGCLDLQENIGAKSETPCTSRPQRTRRLPERLRDYVVNLLKGT